MHRSWNPIDRQKIPSNFNYFTNYSIAFCRFHSTLFSIIFFLTEIGSDTKILRRLCMIGRRELDAPPLDIERNNLIIFIWCAIIPWVFLKIVKFINPVLRTVDALLVEASIIQVCALKRNQSNQFRMPFVVCEYRKLLLQ